MTRLSLVGPSEDGLHLTVQAESGDRFQLPLNDELRHAVRYTRPARPSSEEAAAPDAPAMTPREIQQRIRGGLTAAELAELSGMPLAAIVKYEGPVTAERGYIADLARDTRIGHDASAPQLGDLVTDRLAARGVDPDSVAWDAWREIDEPWRVAADYRVAGKGVRAVWAFDPSSRAVTAEDEEARWLTETELLDVPIPRRHLSAVREADAARPLQPTRPPAPATDATPVVAQEAATVTAETPRSRPVETPTQLLLDDLDLRRGTREPAPAVDDEEEDEDPFEGFGPARSRTAETGFAHPAKRAARDDAPAAPAPATPQVPVEPTDRRASRKGRASVPSWDEIVFGAKSDPS